MSRRPSRYYKSKRKSHNHSSSNWAISRRDDDIAKASAEAALSAEERMLKSREDHKATIEKEKEESRLANLKLRTTYEEHAKLERKISAKIEHTEEQPRPPRCEDISGLRQSTPHLAARGVGRA